MSGTRFSWPNSFSVAPDGVPRVGAKLYFFQTGTNTPQNTYNDASFTVPNSNPVIADADGQFGSVFLLLAPSYRVTLTDADDVEIWTFDPVGPNAGGSGGSTGTTPIGMIAAFGMVTPPSGWLVCDGRNVSRTVFSALFAAIGTNYGIGDGSTTFGLPDSRGRVFAGKDDIGGVAANRLTNAISGVTGTTMGASGGDQRVQVHNHTLTDPGHDHTDSGHDHTTDARSYPTTGGPLAASGSFAFTLPLAVVNTGNANIQSNTTGITIDDYGAGASQNVQPTIIAAYMIYAG